MLEDVCGISLKICWAMLSYIAESPYSWPPHLRWPKGHISTRELANLPLLGFCTVAESCDPQHLEEVVFLVERVEKSWCKWVMFRVVPVVLPNLVELEMTTRGLKGSQQNEGTLEKFINCGINGNYILGISGVQRKLYNSCGSMMFNAHIMGF